MDKFYYLITEGMKNVWRHKMTAFTAIISLFISLFIVGLLATAGDNTHKVLQYLRSKYKIEVFFKQDVSNEEAVGLIHQLKKIKGVRTATIIEKEDAVRIFKDQFGEDIIVILGYNPLPVIAVVNLSRTSRDLIRVEPIIKNSINDLILNQIKLQEQLRVEVQQILPSAEYRKKFLIELMNDGEVNKLLDEKKISTARALAYERLNTYVLRNSGMW